MGVAPMYSCFADNRVSFFATAPKLRNILPLFGFKGYFLHLHLGGVRRYIGHLRGVFRDYFFFLVVTLTFFGFAAAALGMVTISTPSSISALVLGQSPPERAAV